MIKLFKLKKSSISFKEVPRSTVSRWGILSIKNIKKNNFQIKDVIEKPKIKNSPSNFAIIGRYILPKKIINVLKR